MKTVYVKGVAKVVTDLAARRMLYYGEATEAKEEKKEIETKEEKKAKTTKAKK